MSPDGYERTLGGESGHVRTGLCFAINSLFWRKFPVIARIALALRAIVGAPVGRKLL